MEESLKSARLIQRVMLSLFGALLVFGLAPDNTARYYEAKAAIERLIAADLSTYHDIAKIYSEDKEDRHSFMFRVMTSVIRKLNIGIIGLRQQFDTKYEAQMVGKPEDLTVGELYRFVRRKQMVSLSRPGIEDTAERIINRVRQDGMIEEVTTHGEVSLNWSEVKYEAHNWIVGVELATKDRQGFSFKVFPQIIEKDHETVDITSWFQRVTQESGTQSMDVFISIVPVMGEISSVTPSDALAILESKIEQSKSRLTYFGLSVDAEFAVVAGPTLSVLATLFLLAHLRHIRHLLSTSQKSAEVLRDFPWLPLFDERFAKLFTHTMLLAFPLFSNGAIIYRTWQPIGIFFLFGPGALALIAAIGHLAWREVCAIRDAARPIDQIQPTQ